MHSRDSARSASAEAIKRRRDILSASTPAGMDSKRNGSVCAVWSTPVSEAVAPSRSTATRGAAASATCSENCALRLDQARRTNERGSTTASGAGI